MSFSIVDRKKVERDIVTRRIGDKRILTNTRIEEENETNRTLN